LEIGYETAGIYEKIAWHQRGKQEVYQHFRLLHRKETNRVFCQCQETGSEQIIAYRQANRGKSWRATDRHLVVMEETFSLPIRGRGISQWIYLQ